MHGESGKETEIGKQARNKNKSIPFARCKEKLKRLSVFVVLVVQFKLEPTRKEENEKRGIDE